MTSGRDNIAERIEAIVGDVLGKPVRRAEVGSRRLRDLGLGSLRMIRLISDLEAAFQLRIQDEQVTGDNFGTLDRLITFVEDQAGNGNG